MAPNNHYSTHKIIQVFVWRSFPDREFRSRLCQWAGNNLLCWCLHWNKGRGLGSLPRSPLRSQLRSPLRSPLRSRLRSRLHRGPGLFCFRTTVVRLGVGGRSSSGWVLVFWSSSSFSSSSLLFQQTFMLTYNLFKRSNSGFIIARLSHEWVIMIF